MEKKVSIGNGVEKKYSCTIASKPETIDQRLSLLEAKMETIASMIAALQLADKPITDNNNAYEGAANPNKDGIPIGIMLVGTTRGVNHILMVEEFGYSKVQLFEGEPESYASLSAAAEAVSGVRRSGWTFWKLEDGRTLKEAFRKV